MRPDVWAARAVTHADADVKAVDVRGWTAMHHAALGFMRHDHEDFHSIVRHLARCGADMFAIDNDGVIGVD
ncbi:protein of unknown function [Burkholderia multivorans]